MSTEAERTPDEGKIDAATIGHQARLIDRLSTQLRDSTKAVVQKDAAIAELLAALRAAGGQEKPQPVSDPYKLLDEVERIVKFEAGPNDVYMRADVLSVIRQVRAAAPVGGQAEPSDAEPLGIDQLAGILELLSDGDFDRVGVLSNDDARALIREVMRLRQLSFAELVDVAVGRSPAAASGEQR